MTDPIPTTVIPTDNQQAPQTPSQEGDFFGGGEDAFQSATVFDPNQATSEVVSAPFVPQEKAWEPTLPSEEKIEELKNGNMEKGVIEPVIEPIPEPVSKIEELKNGNMEIGPIENVIEPISEIQEEQESIQSNEFASIPAAVPEEKIEELKNGNMEAGVIEPIIETVSEPLAVQEKEPVEMNENLSDLGKKFMELFQLCTNLQNIKKSDEGFQLVGADNDKLRILYKFVLGDPDFPMVTVTKVETDKAEEEEASHELNFYLNEEGNSLNVNLDEELLFEEEVDLADDAKKKMQVVEKLNKFVFLVTEEFKKAEKEIRAKEAEQEEKRKLQDIFRNF